MKHEYTDTQLQAAIDGACNEAAQSAIGFLNTLDLDPQSEVWAEETPARLDLIKSALDALPEPEPPTVDWKAKFEALESQWVAAERAVDNVLKILPELKKSPSWENAAALIREYIDWANARAEKAEAELARIIESAHEAGWNGVENPKDLAQFIKYLAEEVGNRQASLLAACTSVDELKGKAGRWYNQAKSENVKYLAAVEEIQRLKEACEQEVLSLSQLRPLAEAAEPADPYAELKAAHAAGKIIEQIGHGSSDWFGCGSSIAWSRPPECYRIKPEPETFEAHGKTWTRHKPGDPIPCDGEVKIYCIGNMKGLTHEAYPANWWNWSEQSCVIGWRYADDPLVTKSDSSPEWTPQVGDVVRLKSGGPLMTVGKVSDEVEIFCFRGDNLMKTSIPTACLELSTKEDAR